MTKMDRPSIRSHSHDAHGYVRGPGGGRGLSSARFLWIDALTGDLIHLRLRGDEAFLAELEAAGLRLHEEEAEAEEGADPRAA